MASVQRTSNIPADLQSEQIVLANCLLQGSVAPLGDLAPEQFFSEAHRKILTALRALAESHQPIDTVQLNRELTGTGVLPSELAALTDGVPSLTESSLAWYRERIKTLHQERLTLSAAYELGQAAAEGAPVAEIRERASAVLEKTKPAKAPPIVEECPEFPEAAWHPLARRYREIISPTTEAPHNFHLACFLSVVGAALGRHVFFDMSEPVYPNLWSVLVGTSGEPRKGTSIAKAVRIMRAAQANFQQIRSLDSAEGFVQKLSQFQGADKKLYTPVVVRLSELRSLIDKANKEGLRNLIPKLCEAYDGDVLDVGTRSNPLSVEDPFVALLAGTSLAYTSTMKRSDLEGGLGNRLTFIPGRARARIAVPPQPQEPEYSKLADEIQEVLGYWERKGSTQFRLDAEAQNLWTLFYESELPCWAPEDGLLQSMTVRYHHYAIKVATIYAALDGAEPIIRGQHLTPALLYARFLLDGLLYTFASFGLPRWVQDERKIIDAVRVTMPLGIRRRKLQQKFWKLGAEHFERHMKALVRPEGLLRQEGRGKQLWVLLNEE
jgi:hypothetical protein